VDVSFYKVPGMLVNPVIGKLGLVCHLEVNDVGKAES